ncbi:MAG TPA: GAF domain-containing protein [Candidatus Acidoferrales bacterium]|nr:GAF domain-containing protein [Candidatus Acidoferrales bacterium]
MSVSYELLERQVHALLDGEPDPIANAANFAAFVLSEVPGLNWAGFYFVRARNELVLGPFCGKPACTRLSAGSGVCGAAVTRRATVVVDDVRTFDGHIACDTASRSELVVPLLYGGEVVGVFDVDSPTLARFSLSDREGIERLVAVFSRSTSLAAPPAPSVR